MIELSQELQLKAEYIMGSNSHLKGLPYMRSPQKRIFDKLVSTVSLPVILPAIGVLGLLIFLQDGHPPFLKLTENNPYTNSKIGILKRC